MQSIEEVLAEPALPDLLFEITVGGCDQTNIGAAGLRASDRFELTILQHSQQLGLEIDRQLADLVEKQCATIGELESSEPSILGVGKGARHMTKELALHQVGGQSRAVESNERSC